MGPREWHRRCDPRVETGHRRLATLCSFNQASFDGDSYRLPLTGLDLFGHVKFGNGSPSSQPFAQRLRRHRGAIASIRLEDRLCAIRVENLACPGLIIRAAFLSFALRHVECRSSSNARATLTCPAAGNYPCCTLIEVGKHKLAIVRTRGSTFAKGFLLRSTLPSLPCRYTCIRSSLGGAIAPQVVIHSPDGCGGEMGAVTPPLFAPGIGAQPCTPCPPIGYIPEGQLPSAITEKDRVKKKDGIASLVNHFITCSKRQGKHPWSGRLPVDYF